MALSDVGAQYAGDHAAEVQQRHAGAPAVVAGRLALHAGEAEEAAAACGRRGRSGVRGGIWVGDGQVLLLYIRQLFYFYFTIMSASVQLTVLYSCTHL